MYARFKFAQLLPGFFSEVQKIPVIIARIQNPDAFQRIRDASGTHPGSILDASELVPVPPESARSQ